MVDAKSEIKMTEVERLKFQNLQLQKQVVALQEADIVKDIKIRTGTDITGWSMNLETGVCISINQPKISPPKKEVKENGLQSRTD